MLAVDLDGRAGSVRAARLATEEFLDRIARTAGPQFRAETRVDVALVVAELVANACRHAPGPCRLTVCAAAGEVDVAVQDTSSRLLVPPGPAAPGGYGLMIVTRLSDGVQILPVPGGKIIEATVIEH